MKLTGKRSAVTPHAALCVQLRLAYSAGVSPARVKVRSPVAWIAGRRETKVLKPIDKAIYRMVASHQVVAKANTEVASKMRSPEGRAHNAGAKAVWAVRKLTVTTVHFGGVIVTAW